MPHFIEDYWLKNSDKWEGCLVTRFPPEPNGRLHIGHAFLTANIILVIPYQ